MQRAIFRKAKHIILNHHKVNNLLVLLDDGWLVAVLPVMSFSIYIQLLQIVFPKAYLHDAYVIWGKDSDNRRYSQICEQKLWQFIAYFISLSYLSTRNDQGRKTIGKVAFCYHSVTPTRYNCSQSVHLQAIDWLRRFSAFHQSWHCSINGTLFIMLDIMEFYQLG